MNKSACATVLCAIAAMASNSLAEISAASQTVIICFDAALPGVRFAGGELGRAAAERGYRVQEHPLADAVAQAAGPRIAVVAADSPASDAVLSRFPGDLPRLGPQGYAIRRTAGPGHGSLWIVGADVTGAMYGALDVAEMLRFGHGVGEIAEGVHGPAISRRGIKFNIPLDARTPSYDDSGDAAQMNITEMWQEDFWTEFLTAMVKARYNVLTLWNPHPFPSMLELPDYPGVALDDVCVSRIKPTWRHGSIGEHMGVSKEVLENVEVVRRMTIAQKIDFWRRVMRRARDLGIEVYIITWNVLTNSATGKHGITNEQSNPATIAYMRRCVRDLILTYPDLTGIGVTAGENMKDRKDEFSKERWLWATYGQGILDAKQVQPQRQVRFIHRVWQTSVDEIMQEFGSKYPDPFELGFKYARARLYSSPTPPFAASLRQEMRPHGLRCWWNLRNDDIFVFRWGDPEYVRAFLRNLPPASETAGYYVGSDGYVWGREFASTEPDQPRQLEVRKHWYAFTLWGRLGYDLDLKRAHFEKMLADRFPGLGPAGAAALYDAWAEASKIIPLVNRFHWRNWDFMWAVEGCIDQRQGFRTVRDFITTPTMEASGLVPIPAYVDAVCAGKNAEGVVPPRVADELEQYARKSAAGAAAITRAVNEPTKELRLTLGDIEAMCCLGRYYAAKIRGATALALFDKTSEPRYKDQAVAHLEEAVRQWAAYASVATRQYKPQLLARTRELDWLKLLDDVRKDVEMVRSAGKPGG